MRLPVIVLVTGALLVGAPARAEIRLIPPVDGPISRHFEAPSTQWGPGHRGIDYRVAPGTSVAAAGDGTVTFAGDVAGVNAVTIDHGGGLETTYSDMAEVLVSSGERVGAGRWVGRTGYAHPEGDHPGLHFGVIYHDAYVDPLGWLGPVALAGAIHLAPTVPFPPPGAPDWLLADTDRAGNVTRACEAPPTLSSAPAAPNGNIAVALAGIGSHTDPGIAAEMYGYGPELLGYPPDRVYRFSYLGPDGPDLHEPYPTSATYEDLQVAAGRLEELLRAIAIEHPGVPVDLIAHSQGGIVARVYLEAFADPFDPALPRIDHVVTFASPHGGAPGADLPAGLTGQGGGSLVDLISWASQNGLPIPDPLSGAVAQLGTGSSLIEWLASEDIVYGARGLGLSMLGDVVVPTGRAEWPGETDQVVGPEGLLAHSEIVASEAARALAWGFLAGRAPACPGSWEGLGALSGAGIEWATDLIPLLYGWLTDGPLSALWSL